MGGGGLYILCEKEKTGEYNCSINNEDFAVEAVAVAVTYSTWRQLRYKNLGVRLPQLESKIALLLGVRTQSNVNTLTLYSTHIFRLTLLKNIVISENATTDKHLLQESWGKKDALYDPESSGFIPSVSK